MKISIALLGATGTVGQKFISLIHNHPDFDLAYLVASKKNTGKLYKDAVSWRDDSPLPDEIANMTLCDLNELDCSYAISCLPADIANDWEPKLAQKGIHVISNASSFRMDDNVPLVIPEINSDDFALIKKQSYKGKIITNPNCATVFLALALYPLLKLSDIEHIDVVTLQAISGAGYPGISAFDILSNTIPNIDGEEDKLEREVFKILGDKLLSTTIHSHVNRVPVLQGHTIILHVLFKEEVLANEVEEVFKDCEIFYQNLYKVHDNKFHPQPLRDLSPKDQRAHIGRIKQGGSPKRIGLVSMGHNLVRGAAGAALLNLEAFHKYLNK
ncbi:MAG: aspartate-semialdehyde dehydrogenase [Candidatus Cloacimonadota bacterium]|nr:MAG: aspartate-semialdehyde dehydrogenase [Candidatus Cloacimonadota bacterium]